ncbi:hypothetical protein [Bradyrhizobium betae]|nr:hypothetical protein [Bradyrhizobium betae]
MQKYSVGELVDLQSFVVSFGSMMRHNPHGIHVDTQQLENMRAKFSRYADLVSALELPISKNAAKRLLASLNEGDPAPAGDGLIFNGQKKLNLMANTDRLTDLLGEEMGAKLFVMLSPRMADTFEQTDPLFGNEVEAKFPRAAEDISEAGKCLAFGRATAAVFHLMRALESATQAIADKIGATVRDSNGKGLPWGVIADNMRPKIDAMTKGSDEQIKWYRVQHDLVVVNRAWRVPTNHPKETYTPEQAEEVFDATRAFMKELAPLV